MEHAVQSLWCDGTLRENCMLPKGVRGCRLLSVRPQCTIRSRSIENVLCLLLSAGRTTAAAATTTTKTLEVHSTSNSLEMCWIALFNPGRRTVQVLFHLCPTTVVVIVIVILVGKKAE